MSKKQAVITRSLLSAQYRSQAIEGAGRRAWTAREVKNNTAAGVRRERYK
ncbi:MAG: hypothetical protein ABIH46_13405 [Chloroflexota bacterium]